MRSLLGLAALLLALTACGSESGASATDPSEAMPTEVPAASGPVTTRGIITVMDTGRPELCLGPIAESWPPQCGGPPIDGWDWADHDGMFERQQEIRWGQFVVTGTWDGTTLTYVSAIAGALYDAMPEEPSTPPEPEEPLSQEDLDRIAEEVGELPGAQGAYSVDGHVAVDVTYDDGSLQSWVDQEYGEHVVVVSSMLVDVSE